MANVHRKDGHVQIANRIVEAMIEAGFSQRQLNILLVVIRLTYGWNRKAVRLSELDLARLSRLVGPAAIRAGGAFRSDLARLTAEHVLFRLETGRRGLFVWGLNKDFETWGTFAVSQERLESVWHDRRESTRADDDAIDAELDRVRATQRKRKRGEVDPNQTSDDPSEDPVEDPTEDPSKDADEDPSKWPSNRPVGPSIEWPHTGPHTGPVTGPHTGPVSVQISRLKDITPNELQRPKDIERQLKTVVQVPNSSTNNTSTADASSRSENDGNGADLSAFVESQVEQRLGPEHFPAALAFVRRKPPSTAIGWWKEILKVLTTGGAEPVDVAQVCDDDESMTRPFDHPKAFRVFVKNATRDRLYAEAGVERPPPAGGSSGRSARAGESEDPWLRGLARGLGLADDGTPRKGGEND